MGHPRVEVQGIIQQLRNAMGHEKGTLYWDALRRFLLAKLSKREFDHVVIPLLGTQNIQLHNSLIQAILVNAQSGRPAPTSPLTIFSRTEHKKRPRGTMSKQKKEGLKHKHRDSRPQNDVLKHTHQQPLEEPGKEHKRKRRALLCKPELNGQLGREGLYGEERPKKTRVLKHSPGVAGARSVCTARPKHSYTGMVELEPTEVAYGVRQHVASIGMNTTQESVDYLRYAMHEYVNKILDACKAAQPQGLQDGILRLPDLHRAVGELRSVFPPWNVAKLFEQSLVHPEQLPHPFAQ